jgi:DNA-binding NtrC family response regulator
VDGDRALRESCAKFLEADGYRVTLSRRGDEARNLLERQSFEIVLLDLQISGMAGTELLRRVRATSPATVVIATSEDATVHSSVAACDSGAWEYLAKPFSATQLQMLIGRAIHRAHASRSGDTNGEAERSDATTCEVSVLGVSQPIREVICLARRVAATDASVFITGESGTGKECIAQFIHYQSRRRNSPLLAINCAAIPETLLETEMFGHRKGAFTGAVEDKLGLLEVANGGSFFLDELIQMPLSTQAKLLRVVQDGVVRRIGSGRTNAVVNVRFIAATNQSPEDAIRAGRLREDLYYRLRVFPIHLPPLRDRREDIPLLAEHFLRVFWLRHRPGSAMPRLSDRAQHALADHPWRGNIRELQNVLEHGVVLFEPGMVIEPADIPIVRSPALGELQPRQESSLLSEDPDEDGFHECRKRFIAQFECRYLRRLICRTGGNLSKAARIAGIQRATLYHLMAKHGLHREIMVVASDGARPAGT